MIVGVLFDPAALPRFGAGLRIVTPCLDDGFDCGWGIPFLRSCDLHSTSLLYAITVLYVGAVGLFLTTDSAVILLIAQVSTIELYSTGGLPGHGRNLALAVLAAQEAGVVVQALERFSRASATNIIMRRI